MINYREKFTVKEIEEVGDRKAVELINKQGLGNLRITIPHQTEIKKGDTYRVIVRETQE
ncbi:hypothetical protein [Methanonatronarchaeum sp. AMET-Sl]|uniref:hypothetical protein n=1 Tax=Methanonatronarchaeum sp. AMET-Sl TaxID=3037654 RepID=UPI00244E3A3F|nr:hypothetical protein [Methanonatronarchaeum sp. AMET-Sl]WGI17773.1 hypothetical protein QEN48_01845 [Methanonatronarchaeum sp. AMET-Sl]